MDIGAPVPSSFPLFHYGLFRFFPSTISSLSSSVVHHLLSALLYLRQRSMPTFPNVRGFQRTFVTSRSKVSGAALDVLLLDRWRNISAVNSLNCSFLLSLIYHCTYYCNVSLNFYLYNRITWIHSVLAKKNFKENFRN